MSAAVIVRPVIVRPKFDSASRATAAAFVATGAAALSVKINPVSTQDVPTRIFPRASVRGGDLRGLASRSHAIAFVTPPVLFKRSAEIYGEGEPSDYFYTVVTGAVRTCKAMGDGRRQIGAFYLQGDIFGLETRDEHFFTAEAVIDTRVRLIKRNAIAELAMWHVGVACQLLTLTRRELDHSHDQALLLAQSARERVLGFLVSMTERSNTGNYVELPMTRQDIADYLCLTIETVSRTLTQLEDAATISLPAPRRVVWPTKRD